MAWNGNARSIPAHAGEPLVPREAAKASAVYPRPRGGTRPRHASPLVPCGLSPPTRGNLGRRLRVHARTGSIPAHAGEPTTMQASRCATKVYPRPRGGTPRPASQNEYGTGLSPPTRGNRDNAVPCRPPTGSIPAHAGEPIIERFLPHIPPVYPRPRGGTKLTPSITTVRQGLSPPTRGNPNHPRALAPFTRSIPAHAGEPRRNHRGRFADGVYPRPRGGTTLSAFQPPKSRGLSPPTRGNHFGVSPIPGGFRSIPAHAGEPAGFSPSR